MSRSDPQIMRSTENRACARHKGDEPTSSCPRHILFSFQQHPHPRDEEGHGKRRFKLRPKATEPHKVLSTRPENNTLVIQKGHEEERVSLQHATPAPQVNSTPAEIDSHIPMDMPGEQPILQEPEESDFYIVDRVADYRVRNAKSEFKIRWFNYGPQYDTWEPPSHIPRNFVVRFCRQRNIAPPPRD